MCTFLAIAVPGADLAAVRALCPRGLHVEPCQNRSVARIVGPGFLPYWLTSGQCSCDIAPADTSGEDEPETAKLHQERLRRRYESRGWSPAKIERAIADAVVAAGRRYRGIGDDLAAFLGSLVRRFGQLRLLAHVFDGPLDAVLQLQAGGHLDLALLTTDGLAYDRCYDLHENRTVGDD
jgi:hypothetical protein